MKNKSVDLRNPLFATLEALQDKDAPMDIARAQAVANVAGQVIELAKVEVAFIKVTGQMPESDFMPLTPLPGRPVPQIGNR